MSPTGMNLTEAERLVEYVIHVPSSVAEHLRARLEEGHFATEAEYIEHQLETDALLHRDDEAKLVQWMNTEGVRRLEQMQSHPETVLTIEQAFAFLDEPLKDEPSQDELLHDEPLHAGPLEPTSPAQAGVKKRKAA